MDIDEAREAINFISKRNDWDIWKIADIAKESQLTGMITIGLALEVMNKHGDSVCYSLRHSYHDEYNPFPSPLELGYSSWCLKVVTDFVVDYCCNMVSDWEQSRMEAEDYERD